jgi:hypothetical protein
MSHKLRLGAITRFDCLDANTEVPKRPPYQNSGMWMQVSSLRTNSSLQNTPRYQCSLKSETIDKMATIANQRSISIRNIIIYLEAKFRPNRRSFVFWRSFWIQNGRHSKPAIDINSQHHNLLGSQISPKSEDFCILAVILNSKWPP